MIKKLILTILIPLLGLGFAFGQNPLFDSSKKWILASNKIDGDSIEFMPYDTSKIEINTLVFTFKPKGVIEYDYESPNDVDACFGVDYLDIDVDASTWSFNAQSNILTLIIKGGIASLDDFKFKRDYEIWLESSGNYVLRKIKEHYYIDLKKQAEQLARKKN